MVTYSCDIFIDRIFIILICCANKHITKKKCFNSFSAYAVINRYFYMEICEWFVIDWFLVSIFCNENEKPTRKKDFNLHLTEPPHAMNDHYLSKFTDDSTCFRLRWTITTTPSAISKHCQSMGSLTHTESDFYSSFFSIILLIFQGFSGVM